MIFDYAIIGGGIVGCSIFNKLVAKNKSCILLEKEPDLAIGCSKANSGLIHAGFDAKSGTLKAKLNVRGNTLMQDLCNRLKVTFKRTGAVVVGNDLEKLNNLKNRGIKNGVKDLEIVSGEKLKKLVPNLKDEIKFALHAKSAGVVDPFMLTIALAEEAVLNGGQVVLNYNLKECKQDKNKFVLTNGKKSISARKIINASGFGFNEVSKILKTEELPLKFRRGEYIVLDKCNFVNLSVFPLPTNLGKGILATPTYDGNILLGPTADDITEYNLDTTKQGINHILDHIKNTFNNIPLNKNLRQFSGVRVSAGDDFIIEISKLNKNIVNVAGINSPGLSSAPAIAEYVCELLGENGKDKKLIKRKSYTKGPAGKIVCQCELVGEKHILNAIKAPIPATTVDGIKRRVRAGFGRCQGGRCTLEICKLLAKHQNKKLEEINKESTNSFLMLKEEKMTADVVIIGAGPSGMSAALEAEKTGANVLLIDCESRLGGILNQCIHNGFGLKHFKEELTGPEYASRQAKEVLNSKIELLLSTYVKKIEKQKVFAITPSGEIEINCKAIVVATGARERSAGEIYLPGSRPSGLYTAGMAQKMINFYGKLPGKKVVILGSGDIGLIMARRLTLSGAKVEAVLELMPYSSGLRRNITQCIEDFNIPLYFSHTITRVIGKDRVTGVYYAKVDENLNPILSTEKFIECDCVLLSVGLIQENALLPEEIEKQKFVVVDNNRQTSIPGIFVSGNALHIHDLADNATEEGIIAGKNAGLQSLGKLKNSKKVDVSFSNNISYCIPQKLEKNKDKKACIYMRAKNNFLKKSIVVKCNEEIIAKKFCVGITMGEMQEIEVDLKNVKDNLYIDII